MGYEVVFPNMGIGERIKALRASRDWTGYALAQAAGITPSHVKAIEDGETKNPTGKTLAKIAEALGVRVDELLGETTIPAGSDHDAGRPEHSVEVPLRTVASGGAPIEGEDLGETYHVLHHLYRKDREVIRLRGDSMWPTFHNDDLLLVEPVSKVKNGAVAVVQIGHETTVKRVEKKKDGGLILKADNPTHPSRETDPEEAEVKARVICIVEGHRP